MSRKRWKRVYPQTMQEAIRLCLDYAMHKHQRSAKRVADLVGMSEWGIYKWMNDGSIPSKRIAPFELACGCTFITEYIGYNAQKLLVDIPRGCDASQADLLTLQTTLNETVIELASFYGRKAESASVMTTITDAMSALAGHRENVSKADAPELNLFDGGDE